MPAPKDSDFVREHLRDDLSVLALKLDNLARRGEGVSDIPRVLQQIGGYQAIERKLPEWYGHAGLSFPSALSLEQCSSQQTALYKKELVGTLLPETCRYRGADLTGGFGVDAWALSELFQEYRYVERQPSLCEAASCNFQILDRSHIRVCCEDAVAYLSSMERVDFLFLDPSRRDSHGGKVSGLSACEPDITSLWPLLRGKCRFLLLKLSPMLDVSMALKEVPCVQEVHIVAVDNDCKELLLWVDFEGDSPLQHPVCTVHFTSRGRQQFSFSRAEESGAVCEMASQVKTYLYEPNVAVLKAGAFKWVGKAFALEKLHRHTHLYTSDVLRPDFPGRVLEVQRLLRPSSQETKELLTTLDRVNVCTRNYPETTDTLRRRLRLKEGGDRFLYGTTLASGEKVLLLCQAICTGTV